MTDDTDDSSSVSKRRAVRSFVMRAGRVTGAQQRALAQLWPRYGIDFTPAPLDVSQMFGRPAPLMIEIGFGAGEALLAFAQAHPDTNCIGIEVHPPGVGHLLLAAHEAALHNLRMISHDAVEVLRLQIPAASVAVLHIFFPDPWPKKRHHKRRLIQPAFVELLAHVIAPGGTLRLATDWEHYAEQMHDVMAEATAFENLAGEDSDFTARPDLRPITRFERRGQRLGHDVWDLAYRRRGE